METAKSWAWWATDKMGDAVIYCLDGNYQGRVTGVEVMFWGEVLVEYWEVD